MLKNFIILISLSLLFAGQARGDGSEVVRLDAERVRLEAVQDSLLAQRRQAGVEADRMSARIDSLKASLVKGGDAGALQEALRRSLDVAGRLEALNRALERVRAELGGVRERLRAAYDREIAALTEGLAQARNEALIRLMRAYQKARDALRQEAGVAPADALEGLSIREEDGPEEIRQKADLLTDGAVRVRAEAVEMSRRLGQLERERRLRGRAASLAREISVFDEHLPEGRSVAAVEQKSGGTSQATTPPEQKGDAGIAPPATGLVPPSVQGPGNLAGAGQERTSQGASVAGKEVAREGDRAPDDGLSAGDLEVEIQRLKARRKEALDRERALSEKADAFRARLRRMLEERD